MRLNEFEINACKSAVLAQDPTAKVYLFGSRTDDGKMGGDIDLLIESKTIGFSEKQKILLAIQKLIGEQKIDLIVSADCLTTTDPFILAILPGAKPL